MKPEDVLKFYGSLYRFNKSTKMSANTLKNWLLWGYVPKKPQYMLEVITKGVLKTDWSDENDPPS